MSEIEREIKVLNLDLDQFEQKIISLGAKFISEEFQENIVIEREIEPIEETLGAYLRIRTIKVSDNEPEITEFTLKKIIKDKEFKSAKEITTNINNKEAMLEILGDLGFYIKYSGSKYRKSYEFMGSRIDLDRWDKDTYPYPYAEIEFTDSCDKESILKTLEIKETDIVLDTITELRRKLK